MSMEKAKVQQQIDQIILAYEQATNVGHDTQGKVAWDLCLVQIMELLRRWQEVARLQVEFIEHALDQLPDSPTLLYAVAPPPEALLRFFPALYPEIMEPIDTDNYLAIVKQLMAWRKQMEGNSQAMEHMIQSQEAQEKSSLPGQLGPASEEIGTHM